MNIPVQARLSAQDVHPFGSTAHGRASVHMQGSLCQWELMDVEGTWLTLGPHRNFIGLINKKNLTLFCSVCAIRELVKRAPLMQETWQEREITPAEQLRNNAGYTFLFFFFPQSALILEIKTISVFYFCESNYCPSLGIVEKSLMEQQQCEKYL